MKVTAVTPSDDAADPAHPDHDRWVKDVTLKREVQWAEHLGLPLRLAESENVRLLELADNKAAGKRAELAVKKPKNQGHETRKDKRGVVKRVARPRVAGAHLSPCGRCGTCLRCKRERRVATMCALAKQGDMRFVAVLWRLWTYASAAKAGSGRFAEVSPVDANRMVIRKLESVCDDSVKILGEWR